MGYICRMVDGGTKYLSHYGVKGMKWGIWNEETKARYKDMGLTAGGSTAEEDDESRASVGGANLDEDEVLTDEFMDEYAKKHKLDFTGMTREQKKLSVKYRMKQDVENRINHLLGKDKPPSGLTPNMIEIRKLQEEYKKMQEEEARRRNRYK